MSFLVQRLSLVSATFLLVTQPACHEPGESCTDIAVTSVSLTVRNASGQAIEDAAVRYAVNGGSTKDCENLHRGNYACGWEEEGAFVIHVNRTGYTEVQREVTVTSDECHVKGVPLEVTLEATLATHFEASRTYKHTLYADGADCEAAMARGVNCSRVVQFCSNGVAAVMVTDIVNRATYERSANGILMTRDGPGDIPETFTFTHDQEQDTLRDSIVGETWTRSTGNDSLGACN